MDLVDCARSASTRSCASSASFAAQLGAARRRPSSRSARCTATTSSSRSASDALVRGPPLLEHLETSRVEPTAPATAPALPVQLRAARRRRRDCRGYAGRSRRRAAAGRRGRRAAVGRAHRASPRSRRRRGARRGRRAPALGVRALEDELDVGARRPDRAAAEDPPAVTRELEADAVLARRARRCARARATCSSTRPARCAANVDAIEDRLDVDDARARAGAGRARAQRHRPRARCARAARSRPTPTPQPRDRRVHPHRRGDERHGRRGHGRRLNATRVASMELCAVETTFVG